MHMCDERPVSIVRASPTAMTLANVGLDTDEDVTVVNFPPSEHAPDSSPPGEVDAVFRTVPPISTDLRPRAG